MKKINCKMIIFAGLSSLFLIAPLIVFGIGQITTPIEFSNIMRGQEAVARLDLANSNSVATLFDLAADGQIKDWVTFYESDSNKEATFKAEVPANSNKNFFVKFSIPEGTPNGTYKGTIFISEAPVNDANKNETESVSAVGMRIGRSVSITVTDVENIVSEVSITPKKYDFNFDEPLTMEITIKNTGNIAIKPDIQLKVNDTNAKNVFDAIFPYPADQEPIKSNETKVLSSVRWDANDKPASYYRAFVTVKANDKILKEEAFSFTVGIHSQNQLLAGLSQITRQNNNLIIIFLSVIAVLILAVGFLFFRLLKIKNAK